MARSRSDNNTRDELRRRLEALNRKFAKNSKPAVTSADALKPPPKARVKPVAPRVYGRKLPTQQTPTPAPAAARQPPLALEDALDGREQQAAPCGRAFVVSTPVAEVAQAHELSRRFQKRLREQDDGLRRHVDPVIPLDGLTVDDLVFMDIETTGLGNSQVFLVGIMVWAGAGFRVDQFLARNYAEERAVVHLFAGACRERKLLVTFNGKSFDFPFLRTRAAATGVPFGLDPAHLDLLHVGRRIWREQLPNCKLQTLESHLCGRVRRGDIPGAQIPEAYHRYVRSGDARQIVQIMKHNLLDLVTLADIMTRFPVVLP